jgi:hypothetical protein
MDTVPAFERLFWAISWMCVLEQSTSLGIVTSDLNRELVALADYYVRRPYLHVNRVDLPNAWHLYITREVVPVW